jgi:hypothetical protein
MSKFSIYSPLREWKRGEYPVTPFLYLSTGTHYQVEGNLLLSAQLMTVKEVDEVVDQMKLELEEFRIKAKKELKSLQEKMLQK